MAIVHGLQPGNQLGVYRIEAVERTDPEAVVLRAVEAELGRAVLLHVANEAPGTLAATRFLDRARRLRGVEHPHLLGLHGARTLDDRAVAVIAAPPGTRLDQRATGPDEALRVVRQVASAIDALEEAGADAPLLTLERIWVDSAGDACLDGLGTRSYGDSAAAALARLLGALDPRPSRPLEAVLTRARDGAYLSAGQFAADLLRAGEVTSRRRLRWPSLR